MNHSSEHPPPKQSHFQFQMWDQYLNVLNSIWDLEQSTQSLRQERSQTDGSGSLKKFILRLIQPIVNRLRHSRIVAQIIRLDQQREFNARVVQTLNGLVELTNSELDRLKNDVSHHLQQFQTHLDTFQSHLNSAQSHLDKLQQHIENRLEQIEPRFDELDLRFWAYDRRKEALELEQIRSHQKLEQILALLCPQPSQRSEIVQQPIPEPENQQEYAYLLFENLYRGNEETIKQHQTVYLPYFKDCRQVLDIGCGRGEFLELLREHDIDGKGIDANQIMVQYCQNKKLNVEHVHALSYLEALADESLDGIFAAQFVEHCSPKHLARFLQLCYAKLQPQSYLVLETQNPQSLFALSHFYRDLSHDKPVHPDALQYLLKTIGFEDVQVKYLSPLPPEKMLQELEIQKGANVETLRAQLTTLNQNIRQLNDIIYGYLDYAIIARKIHLL